MDDLYSIGLTYYYFPIVDLANICLCNQRKLVEVYQAGIRILVLLTAQFFLRICSDQCFPHE